MWRVSSSPTCVHVPPASVDLNTPTPHGELCRFAGSPVPTHTWLGLEGATLTAPTEEVGWSSNTGSHVMPSFVVFHTPPAPRPT